MRPENHTLDRRQVHRAAAEHLQAHLQFKDYKRKTSAAVLWSLLLAAAARITSLSDACGRLRDAPSDETARKALLATLLDYAELQRRLNAALAGHLPEPLRKRPQRLAIDLTLIPYHGQPFGDPAGVYRSQARGSPRLPGLGPRAVGNRGGDRRRDHRFLEELSSGDPRHHDLRDRVASGSTSPKRFACSFGIRDGD